jgi:hypothetical protein
MDIHDILKQMLEWRSLWFPFVSRWIQTFLFCFCLWVEDYMMENDISDGVADACILIFSGGSQLFSWILANNASLHP